MNIPDKPGFAVEIDEEKVMQAAETGHDGKTQFGEMRTRASLNDNKRRKNNGLSWHHSTGSHPI
ncbi:hypothetical protein JMN23_18955 [Bacillus sp. RHFB]|nr:hypothetical protein [Bacillus sp. RHFB]